MTKLLKGYRADRAALKTIAGALAAVFSLALARLTGWEPGPELKEAFGVLALTALTALLASDAAGVAAHNAEEAMAEDDDEFV
jgi:hypothetical protein